MSFGAGILNDDLIPRPRTCWRTKTLFQSGLILVLMVAVPFFVVMVFVYILILTVSSESETCSRLCSALSQWQSYRTYYDMSDYPDSHHRLAGRKKFTIKPYVPKSTTTTTEPTTTTETTTETTTLSTTETCLCALTSRTTRGLYNYWIMKKAASMQIEQARKELKLFEEYINNTIKLAREKEESILSTAPKLPRSANFQNTSFCFYDRPKFPSVAALLQNLYMDDDEEQILKCSVVVLSPNWVLTIDECVENDAKSLFVRINSDYWSQGGLVKKVEKIIRFRKMVAIRLVQESEHYPCFIPVNISRTAEVTEGQILFWDGKINQALKTRSKFGRIMTISADIVKSESRFFLSDNVSQHGAPLLDQDENLIGFQLHHEKKHKGLPYRSVDGYFKWIELIRKSL